MDNTQIEKQRETDELKQNLGGKLKQEIVQQASNFCSPTSSPSHEFSFTIPLNSSSFTNKNKPPTTPSLSAMDLSPADDIFFHGHLLPLHHLSHLPISPRNSLDSFTLPIQDLHLPHLHHTSNQNNIKKDYELEAQNVRPKAKTFSLFGRSKWRKERENGEKEREKKKPRFEVSQMLKRYMRMVRPLLSMKSSKIRGFQKQPYSFSGNVSFRHDDDDESFETTTTRRRREFSAPASMWTSPTNSGILMAAKGKNLSSPSPSSDSTMEELQAAIQAAITHCKNSIAMEDNIKCNN